ncbi:MAG: hypothetical protein H8E44_39805 [Planctomycetes bacterium]|nr:hypothetical protein [Planctomycetota bacterium]
MEGNADSRQQQAQFGPGGEHKAPVVFIESPPEVGAPAEHAVDLHCNISAYGSANPRYAERIVTVEGFVNNGAVESRSEDGMDWQLDGVGPAFVDPVVPNELQVRLEYIPLGGGPPTWSYWAPREFFGVGGSSACAYPRVSVDRGRASEPVTEVLPRYYRLKLNVEALNPFRPCQTPLEEGPLQLDTICIAYDAGLSTPEVPVWRSASLPEAVGDWTLRLWRSGARLVGELTVVHIGERLVQPPVIFRCMDWDMHGLNVLATVFAPAQSATDAALAVTAEVL